VKKEGKGDTPKFVDESIKEKKKGTEKHITGSDAGGEKSPHQTEG